MPKTLDEALQELIEQRIGQLPKKDKVNRFEMCLWDKDGVKYAWGWKEGVG